MYMAQTSSKLLKNARQNGSAQRAPLPFVRFDELVQVPLHSFEHEMQF
jgi:hypothetical protein